MTARSGESAGGPELVPATVLQAGFWSEVGRTLAVEKKAREQAVRMLLHAEHLAPQYVRRNVLVRETAADLLRQSWRDARGREVRAVWPDA